MWPCPVLVGVGSDVLDCEAAQDKSISALVGWYAGDKVQGSGSQDWRGVAASCTQEESQLQVIHHAYLSSRVPTFLGLCGWDKKPAQVWSRC